MTWYLDSKPVLEDLARLPSRLSVSTLFGSKALSIDKDSGNGGSRLDGKQVARMTA